MLKRIVDYWLILILVGGANGVLKNNFANASIKQSSKMSEKISLLQE